MIKHNSPFDNYIITGDLNNNQAYIYSGVSKNNDSSTWNNYILDYILPINLSTLSVNTYVSTIDIKDTSDHNPLCATIEYLNDA